VTQWRDGDAIVQTAARADGAVLVTVRFTSAELKTLEAQFRYRRR
jgi:hypothetical protein